MRTYKTLLSLMIITLYMVQVHCDIKVPSNTDALFTMLNDDQYDNLHLVYLVVNNDEYDAIFENMENLYEETTVFIKIDTTKCTKCADEFHFVVDTEPTIYFYKSGCWTIPTSIIDEVDLSSLITQYSEMDKKQFCDLNRNQAVNSSQNREQQYQSNSDTQIQYVDNNTSLLYLLKLSATYHIPSIMFIHSGNNDYLKSITQQLASVFDNVLIIDIDSNNYDNTENLYDVNDEQPSLIFGYGAENFVPPEQNKVTSYISNDVNMALESYELTIELVIQRSMRSIQEHGAQDASSRGDNQNEIYNPQNADQLLNILQEADNSGKLCLIYLVVETDEYDYTFVNLAQTYSSTVFIKIDIDNYQSSSCRKFIVQTQPAIIFYKSKRTTDALYSTDRDTISMNIQENLDF